MIEKLRVAIIVDNPKRDLAACTLLADALFNMNFEVFLVPLYIQSRELIAIRPNITILNYHRKGSDWLVEFVLKLKSKVFILETEGAVFADFERTKEMYSTNENLKSQIDGYFIWGKTVYDHFINYSIYPTEKLFLTGSPRTDLLAEKYKEAVSTILVNELAESELQIFKNGYFLINANNALVNGILSDELKTRENLQNTFGYDKNYIDGLLMEQHERMDAIIEIAQKLAEDHPSENFVIRPHPFERIETYKKAANKFNNIFVINNGSIDGWLTNCKGVIMKNCSTSLEAAIAGIPVINISWLNHIHSVPETEKISFAANTIQQLSLEIGNLANGKFRIGSEIAKEREHIIYSMYFSNDGNNHNRIAKIIYEKTQNWKPEKITDNDLKKLLVTSKGISNKIKKFFNLNPFLSLKTFMLEDPNVSWTKTSFYFNEIDVKNILEAIHSQNISNVSNSRFDRKYPFVRSVEILKRQITSL